MNKLKSFMKTALSRILVILIAAAVQIFIQYSVVTWLKDKLTWIEAFLHLLAGYMGTLGGFEVAMLSIYYTVYGASQASGSGVEAYDHVNDKLGQVTAHLESLDNDIARAILQVLIAKGDEQIGDIVGSKGVAGNGLIRFFKQIYDWLMRIIHFIKGLFK